MQGGRHPQGGAEAAPGGQGPLLDSTLLHLACLDIILEIQDVLLDIILDILDFQDTTLAPLFTGLANIVCPGSSLDLLAWIYLLPS